jgi:hypothetical protein
VSIFVSFGPVEMTREEYLRVGDRLPDPPEGRDYHVCAGEDGALYFAEVWESREAMESHDERIGSVLAALYGTERFEEPQGYAVRDVVAIHRPGEPFVRP